MRTRTTLAATALVAAGALLQAQQPSGVVIPVTAENFARAESDRYFASAVKKGGFGKYYHSRQPTPIDKQSVIRMNRDTLYSSGVFDLNAGPVTITLPDAGKRFLSMQVIDEDHYTHAVVYGAGKHTLSKEKIGTRYIAAPVRILVDPANPKDVEEVHKLQDAIKVEQASAGKFEVPNWDPASQKKVRDALLVLGTTIPDTKRMFGARDQVDPVRHLIGSAMAWGGNPEKDAFYLNVTPPHNDGKTIYQLTVKDVPVDAFWSISVYNAQGYFEPNRRTPTRSTTSPRRRTTTARSPSSSAAATARPPTACRSCPAGTTSSASTAPERRSSTAPGSFRKPCRCEPFATGDGRCSPAIAIALSAAAHATDGAAGVHPAVCEECWWTQEKP